MDNKKEGGKYKKPEMIIFMNLTIEQPSTLIKISKKIVKEENSQVQKLEGCHFPKVDFYSMSDDIEESVMFSQISFDTKKAKKIVSSENATLLAKNLSSSEISQENCSKTFNVKMQLELDTKSIASDKEFGEFAIFKLALDYDIRIKKYEVYENYILINFFCVADAISFYRQYFNIFEISFKPFNDWSFTSFDFPYKCDNKVIYKKTLASSELINEVKSDEIYGKERFESKIRYFNNLKSEFTKLELQNFLINLENSNINFIFENTKKLAVGCKSNKIMQDAIKLMSGTEIDKVFNCLEYDIVPISATKHGAYTIQTLLSYATNKSHRELISKYFKHEGGFLLSHEIGNYTFQLLIEFNSHLVNELFISNINDVINSELGFKVFKKCSELIAVDKGQLLRRMAEVDYSMKTYAIQVLGILNHL